MKQVKIEAEDEDTEVVQPHAEEELGSDSGEEAPDSFLAKRQQNIMANKAMVNQNRNMCV